MNKEVIVDQTIPKALHAAEMSQFVMTVQDVGIVGLAILVLLFVGGLALRKYVLDGKRADAESGFLTHMGGRLEKMEALVEKLASENKTLLLENAAMSARIALLEQHEAEVSKLRRILDQKDDKISDLEIALENLTQDKQQLERRVRALEKQSVECECKVSPHNRRKDDHLESE